MSKGEESAFPQSPASDGSARELGLSKREYFAGLAMQGLLASTHLVPTEVVGPQIAILAVEHADALIEELNGEQK